MKRVYGWIAASFFFIVTLAACPPQQGYELGGTHVGNPGDPPADAEPMPALSYQKVTLTVPQVKDVEGMETGQSPGACVADQVVVTDVSLQSTKVAVKGDCTCTLWLLAKKYTFGLFNAGKFLSYIWYVQDDGTLKKYFTVPPDESQGAVDLGQIVLVLNERGEFIARRGEEVEAEAAAAAAEAAGAEEQAVVGIGDEEAGAPAEETDGILLVRPADDDRYILEEPETEDGGFFMGPPPSGEAEEEAEIRRIDRDVIRRIGPIDQPPENPSEQIR